MTALDTAYSPSSALPAPMAPAGSGSQWEQQKAKFLAAKTAEDLFDRTVAHPYWEAQERIGETLTLDQQISEECDRLLEARCDAEEGLIAAPAPDIAALLWKITYARERWCEFEDWPDGWWEAVLSDLKRFSCLRLS